MYVAHQNTDNIVTFRVDKATGKLSFSGQQMVSPGQPVSIIFHSGLAMGNSGKAGVLFRANQDPVMPDSNGLGQVSLSWNAPGVSTVEIRIGGPDGVNMGRFPSYGTITTGRWVSNGMMFYLQDAGKALTAENTLGTARARFLV